MLDTGLIASGIAIVVVLYVASRLVPSPAFDRGELLDRLAMPAVGGLLAGRAVAAAFDDAASLRTLRSFLVIRGGVEFWPGALAMALLVAVGARRRRGGVLFELAEMAPFALWGYATFEAACLVRDGCYGPASPLGLRPEGLHTRMLPIGVLVGVAVAVIGYLVQRLWSSPPATKLALAVGGVAATRAVASIWLPRLGDGLTRQHVESIVVASVAAVAWTALVARARVRRRAHRHSVAAAEPLDAP